MNKKENFILVYDSGLGGLSTLKELLTFCPDRNFLYIADFLNSPYGNKTKTEIQNIVLKNINFFSKKFNIKAIVFACNTITAVGIDLVRKKYNIPVIGAEPAVLPALRANSKKILVLSTFATRKYSKLLKSYKKDERFLFFAPKNLAQLIDENYFKDSQKIENYLKRELKRFVLKVDAIVLGCTHYCLIKKELKNIFGNSMFFDGNQGIAKRLNVLVKDSVIKQNIKLVSTDKNKQNLLCSCFKKFVKGEDKCAD